MREKSKNNVLHITYQSKTQVQNHFWLTWTTLGCGGTIITPVNITANLNRLYRDAERVECSWQIKAPIGKRVLLNVDTLAVFQKTDVKCQYTDGGEDFIGMAIFSGSSNRSGYPQCTICTSAKNFTYKSHTNELFLMLKHPMKSVMPDADGNFFIASVNFVGADTNNKDECGGIVEVSSTRTTAVHSPRYPEEYERGTECQWLFKAPPGYYIVYTIREYITPNAHEQQTEKKWIPRAISNLTCQDPLPMIEGALTIYGGNSTKSEKIERICLDIDQPKEIPVFASESLVTFRGAAVARIHMTGEDQHVKKIGFLLEARPACGGLVLADDIEQVITFRDLDEELCNVTIRKKDESASGIYARLDEFSPLGGPPPRGSGGGVQFGNNFIEIQIDGGEKMSRETEGQVDATPTHEEFRAKNEIRINYVKRNSLLATKMVIAYSTLIENCGAEVTSRRGVISIPEIDGDFDCEWTLRENPGNSIRASLKTLRTPYSPNCTDSYVEFRKWNVSGPLIGRWCGMETSEMRAEEEMIWIKFRYVKPDEADIDDDLEKPAMEVLFYRSHGGITTSHVIQQPLLPLTDTYIEATWIVEGDPDKALLVHIDQIKVPDENDIGFKTMKKTGLVLSPAWDMKYVASQTERPGNVRVVGFVPPADIYLPYSRLEVSFLAPVRSEFKLTWQSVEKRTKTSGTEIGKKGEKKVYPCGSIMVATWEWQELRNPLPPGKDVGYENNVHCKWTIERPIMTGLRVKITMLSLEDAVACPFDFIALLPDLDSSEDNGDSFHAGQKYCRFTDVNTTLDYSYNKILYVHFVTDRSRSGQGFRLQFRLTCNSFDYIRPTYGLLDHILTSPGYPKSEADQKCMWSIVVASNRRIGFEILDLDLEKTDGCTTDVLSVSPRSIPSPQHHKKESLFCGTIDSLKNRNGTAQNGRLFVRYANTEANHRGFKMRIFEVSEDCSSENLFVDETEPSKLLTTPGYPATIPHSLDCHYTLRAPNGHRLKFTVNPENFNLESTEDDCNCDSCDWLEIRDGPTEHSPLIGRYCNVYAPSTIFSTGNLLFVRIRTDSFAASNGFTAVFELASCGGTVVLRPDFNYSLTSPNYPEVYPLRSECDWSVRTPNSHMVEAKVVHMGLSWSVNCTTDSLSIRDGNKTAPYLLEPQCNDRYLSKTEYRSASSEITVQFRSNGTIQKAGRQLCKDKKCGFELMLSLSNESCGGIVTDQHGQLTTPGYPGRLLPHVKCVWELSAGIEYRYLLSFEFLGDRDGFYQKRYEGDSDDTGCFADLIFFNGKPEHEAINYRNDRVFCTNRKDFISDADLLTVTYSDSYTKHYKGVLEDSSEDVYYVPFRVNYTKVPNIYDANGCSYLLTKNITMRFGNLSSTVSDGVRYCHAMFQRPTGYSTTLVEISEYYENTVLHVSECSDWSNLLIIESATDDPQVVNERICKASFMNSSTPISRLYLNQELELHAFFTQLAFTPEEGMSFKLDIQYFRCGGLISDSNFGVITSPNFGDNRAYLSNSHCLWMLVAPEGMVVKMKITDMDIEHTTACGADVLIVGEGRDNDVIHRYCSRERRYGNETEDELLKDRFKVVKSRSRYLTLTWTTDSSNEYRGWRIEYEFMLESAECGFATHAMTGMVHSPNWPQDYGNDEECLWDIQVPLGYHIHLQFTHFDIAPSEDCAKDSLTISQEHSSKAFAPIGDYFFDFEDEEVHSPLCGITLPKSFRSESNRIRLNFTSDEATTAAGFRAEWKAECGAAFRLIHGVISSPNYPYYYPNLNNVCEYLIAPKGSGEKSVIVIKLIDFDLSDSKMDYSRQPCASDYLEVRDVINKRMVTSYCGGEPMSEEPVAIKGAVGLRFITNQSYIYGPKKLHRGFQFSYSIDKCGGRIELNESSGYLATISSPAFPLDYPHNLDCLWNVTASDNRVISVKYEFMELEFSNGCGMDFVELLDGTDLNGISMGKICGTKSQMPLGRLYTKSNNLVVHFVTDHTLSKGGFKIVVIATLGEKSGCGGKLKATGDWQILRPPLDAQGQYIHNLHCGWNIIGKDRTMLELKLTKIDTEELQALPGQLSPSGSRCTDAITIYDGYKSFSPILASDICEDTVGNTLPLLYHTSHRVAHVYFQSDMNGSGSGFELLYRSIKPDCGDWLVATSDTQTYSYRSKNNKDRLGGQTNQRCQWVIQSKSQTPIWLHFSTLKFPSTDGDCSDAFVEIRDVGLISKCQHPACANENSDRKTFRICGTTPFPPFISNTMVVQITTSAVINDEDSAQFVVSYRLLDGCNRTVSAEEHPSGRLTSPNFPNPYDHNSTCTTTIQAPEQKRILLVFRAFDFERGRVSFYHTNASFRALHYWRRRVYANRCDFDYVQINEAGRNSSGPMCGRGLPSTYFSWGNAVEVFMKTDHNMATEGYEVSYFTGKLRDDESIDFSPSYDSRGAITNIGYPRGYNASTRTSWTIMPPNGHMCSVDITVLSIAKSSEGPDCLRQAEYLEIEQATGNPSHPNGGKDTIRLRSCAHITPISIEMEPGIERYVKIKFVSDERTDNDGSGFRLSWQCSDYPIPRT